MGRELRSVPRSLARPILLDRHGRSRHGAEHRAGGPRSESGRRRELRPLPSRRLVLRLEKYAHSIETMGNVMDQDQQDARPPLTTYEELAKMIDHSLLRPELTEEQVAEGCRIARQYQVASVTVRPCDVDFAVRQMQGSGVAVGGVAGVPHRSRTTATQLYQTRA